MPEPKTLRVQHYFDRVASRYDLLNTILSFGLHHLWKRQATALAGLRPGETVADLCGGTGDLALLAAREVGPEGMVLLYDLNRAMLAAGLPKLARSPYRSRIHRLQGDAEAVALKDSSVDAVLIGFGVRNLARLEVGLGEIFRILKPGGRVVILEFSQPRAPLWRWLYDQYSFLLMPRLGRLLAGSEEAYAYLVHSIRQFCRPEELADLLRQAGFHRVVFRPLTGGIAVLHRGEKCSAALPVQPFPEAPDIARDIAALKDA